MNVRFSPTLSDEEIRHEAVRLVVADLERKAAEQQQQQQHAAELEREATVQETQVC